MKSLKMSRVIGCVVVLAMALSMLFCMTIPAAADEKDVRNAKSGVMCMKVTLSLADGAEEWYWSGSCFLINENTIVTANHVVHLSARDLAYLASKYGITEKQANDSLKYEVVISRDLTVTATLKHSSTAMDFAVLALDTKISNRTPLTLRHSSEVEQAEKVYSIGFPGSKRSETVTQVYYNEKDMIIETGILNRKQYTEEEYVGYSSSDGLYDFHFVGDVLVLSSGTASSGNSGGPMVDENGYVIGVVSYGNSSVAGSSYCSASDQVIEALGALSIDHKIKGDVTPADPIDALKSKVNVAKSYDKDDYTEESYAELEDAIKEAQDVLDAEDEDKAEAAISKLDKAISGLIVVEQGNKKDENGEKDKSSSNLALYIIIAIVALIVIGAVVLVIVLTTRKKGDAAPAVAPAPAPAPVMPPVQQAPAFAPTPQPQAQIPVNAAAPNPYAPADSAETSVLSADGGETTVLSADGGETTVLSANGGTIIRVSNNENIPITYSGFTIGKKRKEVDYCIGDNTNISRNHAKFIVRDGETYITDNKSTNGTFVNNTTVRPGDEVLLKDGDTIMLADEKFIFKK